MEASIRPWFTTGVALVGATAIAMAPLAPITASSPTMGVRAAAATVSSEVQLTAVELPYILTLPIVRQAVSNWAENWAVYLAGLAKSGVGIGQSVLAIPGVTVEIIQEVLALDFVGAFDTFATAVRDSVVAVGQPLLDSLIWRNQKALAVQTALQAAVPQALIDSINGFLVAGNGVVTSLIVGTQDLVAAILTFNLGNIIDAAVDGTRNFIVALGAGAEAIVDGIEAAQLGIATALATPPPPTTLADVSELSTFAVDGTLSLARASSAVTLDVAAPTQEQPTTSADDISAVVDDPSTLAGVSPAVKSRGAPAIRGLDWCGRGDDADAEPQDPSEAPATDSSSSSDNSHDATAPAIRPEPVDATPAEDDETVKKGTAGVEKGVAAKEGAGVQNDAGVKDDAGTAAKPASDADDQ